MKINFFLNYFFIFVYTIKNYIGGPKSLKKPHGKIRSRRRDLEFSNRRRFIEHTVQTTYPKKFQKSRMYIPFPHGVPKYRKGAGKD